MHAAVRALPLDTVKMDDRKRPASDDRGQSKRQAVTVNGVPARADEDMPKDEDLDVSTIKLLRH